MLALIIFLSGAAVMMIELAGSRVLSPYVGSSLFVWTSLIGIVLGSLSLGYWWGGIRASKNPNWREFSELFLASGISVACIKPLELWVVAPLSHGLGDIRVLSLLWGVLLFALPSVLLGMVSPYAVALGMRPHDSVGKTVGSLYAISTLGSIAGTFVAGFYLLPAIGLTQFLSLISVVLILLSPMAYIAGRKRISPSLILVVGILIVAVLVLGNMLVTPGVTEEDTSYSRIWIRDTVGPGGKPVRQLLTSPFGVQSAMYLDGTEDLVSEYQKYYRLAGYFVPTMTQALMIGGGGYNYPKDFLRMYPKSRLDTVEVDPGMTRVAREYFALSDDPRLRLIEADGRMYLRSTTEVYDAVFIDAFVRSFELPSHLVTVPAIELLYTKVRPGGVVMVNIISALRGEKGKVVASVAKTFRSVFDNVRLFAVQNPMAEIDVQNIMLLAQKYPVAPLRQNSTFQDMLSHEWHGELEDAHILTDDYAPLEYMSMKLEQR